MAYSVNVCLMFKTIWTLVLLQRFKPDFVCFILLCLLVANGQRVVQILGSFSVFSGMNPLCVSTWELLHAILLSGWNHSKVSSQKRKKNHLHFNESICSGQTLSDNFYNVKSTSVGDFTAASRLGFESPKARKPGEPFENSDNHSSYFTLKWDCDDAQTTLSMYK